jgi:hypothetical protein
MWHRRPIEIGTKPVGIGGYPYANAMDHKGLSESSNSISKASSTQIALRKAILVAG